jgi:hypothetical protein
MNDIVGLSGYLAIGVAVLLLAAALVLGRRLGDTSAERDSDGPVQDAPPRPAAAG